MKTFKVRATSTRTGRVLNRTFKTEAGRQKYVESLDKDWVVTDGRIAATLPADRQVTFTLSVQDAADVLTAIRNGATNPPLFTKLAVQFVEQNLS